MGRKIHIFLGDYTEESQLLTADTPAIMEAEAKNVADLSIIDAAYGADPDEQLVKLQQLEIAIHNTLQKGGSVLLPVPIHGRSHNWSYGQMNVFQIIN